MHKISGKHRDLHGREEDYFINIRLMKKTNKKRNPVAKQLRHFKNKVIKNKRIYDRKNNKISY